MESEYVFGQVTTPDEALVWFAYLAWVFIWVGHEVLVSEYVDEMSSLLILQRGL